LDRPANDLDPGPLVVVFSLYALERLAGAQQRNSAARQCALFKGCAELAHIALPATLLATSRSPTTSPSQKTSIE
jgi:hypothetical protein